MINTNPCVLLSLRKREPGMSSSNSPFHLCKERLEIAQEVTLVAFLHEPRALLIPGQKKIQRVKNMQVQITQNKI